MKKEDNSKVAMIIALALIIVIGGWIFIVGWYTVGNLPSDFTISDELKALPIMLIGCALVSIILMKRSNKNIVKR